jgi:DNA-directed RNA polymerase specialized sigma24 family protein
VSSRSRFNTLVAQHQPMVARIFASYERDRDLAREVVQDVPFVLPETGFRGGFRRL